MPLSMANPGETKYIKRIGGRADTRKFLEGLGFVVGGMVTVISVNGGNMIVQVKDARIAISREMANKITV
ncbi:MAG: ferrous iron transport protein A [Butyricicoccaceae bacterium]